ncbi:hypothetical protein SteCoe_16373 [Stentor coeruleus]|uniref:Kinesin motor domain-containing protein n=1 Tax=Stentor coeruleus TaxID=5963 RepID=A0A1R2C1H9_9CILI|nr:hypothetical protein SteCoe_16373 [Stentor coeruleus]
MQRSENIQVALRFRPLNVRETLRKDPEIWEISENSTYLKPSWSEKLQDSRKISNSKAYTYNYCFSSQETNEDVYTSTSRKVVEASLQGYNGTIIAYGQTGSGKTYTMMGSDGAELDSALNTSHSINDISIEKHEIPKAKGIVILALEDLLKLSKDNTNKSCYLSCSYLEIYNEQIFDLLADKEKITDTLILQEEKGQGFYIRGLSEHVLNSVSDVEKLIKKGEFNRHYAATAMNHHSSRSHTIFRVYVTSVSINKGSYDIGENITTESLLNFVDLAGAERVNSLQEAINPLETSVRFMASRSPRASPRLRSSSTRRSIDTFVNEGKHINVSLFYLCQVISKLSEKHQMPETHIPYRNSSLTKILSTSLGGNALTCIICTATSTLSQVELTLSTLRFGGIAGSIQNVVKANIHSDKTNELLLMYQKDIEELRQRLNAYENESKSVVVETEGIDATINTEGNDIRKILEERIKMITGILFSKKLSENEPQAKELWSEGAGDLIVDTKLVGSKKLNESLNTSADFAMTRMKEMHKEKDKQQQYIEELEQKIQYLTDSKNNLTNDLKKSLQICQTETAKRVSYKQQLTATEIQVEEKGKIINSVVENKDKEIQALKDRVNLVEKFSGLDKLNNDELERMERMYFHGLDMVKNTRFQMKYFKEIESLKSIIDKGSKNQENIMREL